MMMVEVVEVDPDALRSTRMVVTLPPLTHPHTPLYTRPSFCTPLHLHTPPPD